MIVGAGLAGCCLAWRLQQAGQPFRLVGSSLLPSAAKAAAGIINPVTGRWMTKSWRFDDFGPEAAQFYAEIGHSFSEKLYHSIPARRFCLNADDAKRARRRCRNPRYAKVLGPFEAPEAPNGLFNNPHGSFPILGAAYVDLPRLVATLRMHFQSGGHYDDQVFAHQALKKTGSGWAYAGQNYRRVVFCEGAALPANPWFRDLPLSPAKGETLLCHSKALETENTLCHHGKWMLPYPDGSFRIGATYDECDPHPEPTALAREELSQAFHAMMREPQPLKVLDQPAGIRPGTSDARPFLGAHPSEPGLFIFNGLGSKGASLAPTLSRELLEFIFENKALDPETDIRRF
ncbi:MAG: NAD(P)/FAD-dependent oxidoreductase [Opitutales bacterium]